MVRIRAKYADGAEVVFDSTQRGFVTGDEKLLAELAASRAVGSVVPGAETLVLSSYDVSPDHFVAATWAVRAPERPDFLEMVGVEPQPDTPIADVPPLPA